MTITELVCLGFGLWLVSLIAAAWFGYDWGQSDREWRLPAAWWARRRPATNPYPPAPQAPSWPPAEVAERRATLADLEPAAVPEPRHPLLLAAELAQRTMTRHYDTCSLCGSSVACPIGRDLAATRDRNLSELNRATTRAATGPDTGELAMLYGRDYPSLPSPRAAR